MRAIVLSNFGGLDSLVYKDVPELFGTTGFPLSDVPLQKIAAAAASGRLAIKPARVFRFDEIHEAHRVMEANGARGKMVVVHD